MLMLNFVGVCVLWEKCEFSHQKALTELTVITNIWIIPNWVWYNISARKPWNKSVFVGKKKNFVKQGC